MSCADVPPVIWREALDDGRGLDELAPVSTARPWVLVDAAEVWPPRRRPSSRRLETFPPQEHTMPTLDDLLEDPAGHDLALLALRELFTGHTEGIHRAIYLATRRQAVEKLRTSPTWVLEEERNEAIRLDGLTLTPHSPTTPLGCGIWRLWLPMMETWRPKGFGIPIEARDLVGAVATVDQRFPLADWWLEADRLGRPWRHESISEAAPVGEAPDGA